MHFVCDTGYEYQRHVVNDRLLQLWGLHPEAVNWITATPKSKWARAYDNEGQRWGHMTINFAESINSVPKGVQFLPVLGLVKAMFYRLTHYWVERA